MAGTTQQGGIERWVGVTRKAARCKMVFPCLTQTLYLYPTNTLSFQVTRFKGKTSRPDVGCDLWEMGELLLLDRNLRRKKHTNAV